MCASSTKTYECRGCCGRDDATLGRMLAIKDEVLAGLGGEPLSPR